MKPYIYLCAALLLAACTGEKGNNEDTDSSKPLTTAPAETHVEAEDTTSAKNVDAISSATNVGNSPTFNGVIIVSPRNKATLSLTMGGKIHSLSIMPGQYVNKGQVVATIDNPDFIELQQSYLEAAAQDEYLVQEYQRQRTLGEKDAASAKRVQQCKSEFLSVRSRVEASAARLRALGIDPSKLGDKGIISYLPVTAPFSGYATNISVNTGTYLDAGEPVCDIIDKSRPLIEMTVYEKDLTLMKEGRKIIFRVNGLGDATFDASIVSIDQSINEKDYSIKVYAQVSNGHKDFRPGMYVRAKIVSQQ